MALILSVGICLLAGVTFMYSTQYFWGKESNSNINTLNCTMNNLTSSFGTFNVLSVIVVVVVLAAIIMFMCSCRGF